MSDRLNWGILGTGAIGVTLANALAKSRTGVLVAVGSRSRESAGKFGEQFHLPPRKCYASYEELLRDAEVQTVYVALPHTMHAEWAIAAMEAGKHVLVEKPMAVNQFQAMAMVEAAIANDVLLMEAFMYRCHPQTRKLVELLGQKVIGDVRAVHASFSFASEFDAASRLYRNDLAGGAILDIGCYPASMARLIAGAAMGKGFADPLEIKAVGHLESTGVDGYTAAVLKFPGDILAHLSAGIAINQEKALRIFGTAGSIVVPNPWISHRGGPELGRVFVHRNHQLDAEEYLTPAEVTSFTLEVDVFGDAVVAGLKQAPPPAMTWDDSLGNMKTLDAWREQIGVRYEFEKPEAYPRMTVRNRPLKIPSSSRMQYGPIAGIQKKISRLVLGVDNQNTLPHAMTMFDAWFEAGGNAFDTAYVYGGGVHEKNLGHWLKNRGVREEVVIIAKGAHTPECNPAAVARQLAISLERMQTDYADIYLLHRDNPDVPVGEFVEAMNEQVIAGRIKAFGGSNWSIDRVTEANAYADQHGLNKFSAISNNFSLARMISPIWAGSVSASDERSREWLTQTQTAFFAWSSQARGFFTDRAHRDQSLNDEEMNRCWHSDENWRRRERAVELARKRNAAPINIALAYVLNQPFPTFPLIGPRTLEELRGSLKAMDVELTADEAAWLDLRG